jgi:lipopolysaccharide/colanic/teichoic acid biosynthesis glycosyltransferase
MRMFDYRNLDLALKRTGDIAFSAVGLILLLPLFAIVAVAIKLDSPGPVFFRHARAGKGLRKFFMVKFRTMVDNAVRLGPEVTVSNDKRVTRVGRILRKTKIDELPQLWNVLLGDMSLVGPRPQSYSYIPYYSNDDLSQILSVRPGVTGPTQLWLRHEEELLRAQKDPIDFYTTKLLPLKIESDKRYVGTRSLAKDIACVAATVGAVLKLKPETKEILIDPAYYATSAAASDSEQQLETAA